jgi:hypothetical protein
MRVVVRLVATWWEVLAAAVVLVLLEEMERPVLAETVATDLQAALRRSASPEREVAAAVASPAHRMVLAEAAAAARAVEPTTARST